MLVIVLDGLTHRPQPSSTRNCVCCAAPCLVPHSHSPQPSLAIPMGIPPGMETLTQPQTRGGYGYGYERWYPGVYPCYSLSCHCHRVASNLYALSERVAQQSSQTTKICIGKLSLLRHRSFARNGCRCFQNSISALSPIPFDAVSIILALPIIPTASRLFSLSQLSSSPTIST